MRHYLIFTIIIFLLARPSVVFASEGHCKDAKQLYQQTREEQRRGYSLERGRWLRCVEQHSKDAERKYCRSSTRPVKGKKSSAAPSLESQIREICLNYR